MGAALCVILTSLARPRVKAARVDPASTARTASDRVVRRTRDEKGSLVHGGEFLTGVSRKLSAIGEVSGEGGFFMPRAFAVLLASAALLTSPVALRAQTTTPSGFGVVSSANLYNG